MLSGAVQQTWLCCELREDLEGGGAIGGDLPLADHMRRFDPGAMVAAAEWNALKPIIGPVILLIKR